MENWEPPVEMSEVSNASFYPTCGESHSQLKMCGAQLHGIDGVEFEPSVGIYGGFTMHGLTLLTKSKFGSWILIFALLDRKRSQEAYSFGHSKARHMEHLNHNKSKEPQQKQRTTTSSPVSRSGEGFGLLHNCSVDIHPSF